jgi:hypothetical protein
MKKYILSFLLLLLPMFAHANVANVDIKDDPALYKVDSIEDVEKDLTKRFILGTLGKDALIYFLPSDSPDSLKNQIKSLSDGDVYRISKPFNSSIISGTLIIVAAFFLVALVTMIFYIIWVYAESLLRTQDSGEFLGSRWSKVFTPLKIVVGFLLIFPMFGQSHAPFKNVSASLSNGSQSWNMGAFSLAQLAIISSAGASSQQANIVFGEFIRSMPRHYPVVGMPNLVSKASFMSNLIDFMVCSKSSYNAVINTSFNRYDSDDKSVYKLKIAAGKCELSGQIGYDEATETELKNNAQLQGLVGNINYTNIQKTAITNALNNALSTASIVADKIIQAESSNTIFKSSMDADPSKWRDACTSIGSMLPNAAYESDTILYTLYASNCMSKKFIEDLSKTTYDSSYLYGDTNYLRGSAFELCVHDVGFTGKTKSITFAKFKDEEFVYGPKYKLVKECVAQACSGDKAFECASAIHFAKSVADKEELARMGWITGGANVYKIFSGYENTAARSIINKSNFDVDYYAFTKKFADLYANSAPIIDSIPVTINAVSPVRNFGYSDFSNYSDRKSNTAETLQIEKFRYKSFLDGGNDGWFGIPKLQSCVEHPMQIYNGYLCGNVTEEVHLFGTKLLALGLQVKLASLFIPQQNNAKKFSGQGSISQSSVNMAKSLGNILGAGAIGSVSFLLGGTIVGTDSFSDIDQEIWQQYPEITGFLGAAAAGSVTGSANLVSSSVTQLLNVFTGLAMLLGIMFGFLMPLLPFALWIIAVGGWIIALFEALVLCQIWGVVLISPSADHTSDAARKSTIIVVSILLKAPLLVTGLIVAWLLNNILLSEMLAFSDVSTALALDTSAMIKGLIDQLIVLVIYFVILYGMYNIIFSLIESFEKITIDVLFSGQSMSPFAQKQRNNGWSGSIRSASNTLIKT